jgi:hypothetical protein
LLAAARLKALKFAARRLCNYRSIPTLFLVTGVSSLAILLMFVLVAPASRCIDRQQSKAGAESYFSFSLFCQSAPAPLFALRQRPWRCAKFQLRVAGCLASNDADARIAIARSTAVTSHRTADRIDSIGVVPAAAVLFNSNAEM